MSRPWDNEPTPITDAINESGNWLYDAKNMYNRMEANARDLERRLRHARRLLAGHDTALDNGPDGITDWIGKVDEYLAAAKEGGE